MKKDKITFKEIAEMSGLSVGTVSRYFNDYNISDSAKEKIKKILEKYNYIPNYSASMVKKKSKDVYLITPYNRWQNANIEVMNGIKNELENLGYNFFVCVSSENEEIYQKDFDEIIKRNPYGTILLLPKITSNEFIENIKRFNNNNIAIYNRPDIKCEGIKSIFIDDKKMFSELTSILINEKIYKHISFLGLDDSDITTGLSRKEGFLNVMKTSNINVYSIKQIPINDNYIAYKEAGELLESGVDSIICATHELFLSTMKYIYDNPKYMVVNVTNIGTNSFTEELLKPRHSIIIDYFGIGKKLANAIVFDNYDHNVLNLYKFEN